MHRARARSPGAPRSRPAEVSRPSHAYTQLERDNNGLVQHVQDLSQRTNELVYALNNTTVTLRQEQAEKRALQEQLEALGPGSPPQAGGPSPQQARSPARQARAGQPPPHRTAEALPEPAPLPPPAFEGGRGESGGFAEGVDAEEAAMRQALRQAQHYGRNWMAMGERTAHFEEHLPPHASASVVDPSAVRGLEPWARLSSSVWLLHLGLLGLIATFQYWAPLGAQSGRPGYFLHVLWLAGLLLWVLRQDWVLRAPKVEEELRQKRRAVKSACDTCSVSPARSPAKSSGAGTAQLEATNPAKTKTLREVWRFADESEYVATTVMGIVGTDADFMALAVWCLIVVASQLSLVTLLATSSSVGLVVDKRSDFGDGAAAAFASPRWEAASYLSAGLVVILLVFGRLVSGARLVALSSHLAFLKASEEAWGLRCFVRGRRLLSPTAVCSDVEGEAVEASQLPSWPRVVVLVLLAWCQVAVALIVGEHCAASVRERFGERDVLSALVELVGLALILQLDRLVGRARLEASGQRTIGEPNRRVCPQLSAIWTQYTMPGYRCAWHDTYEREYAEEGAAATLSSHSRMQRACLHALLPCFHSLVLLSCSRYYRLSSADDENALRATGYLVGFLLFMLAHHSSAWPWIETKVCRGGLGLVGVGFAFSLVLNLADLASDCDPHPQPDGQAAPQWHCGKASWMIAFIEGGLLHGFVTCYFISACFKGSAWATSVAEHPAQRERDAQPAQRLARRSEAGQSTDGGASSPSGAHRQEPRQESSAAEGEVVDGVFSGLLLAMLALCGYLGYLVASGGQSGLPTSIAISGASDQTIGMGVANASAPGETDGRRLGGSASAATDGSVAQLAGAIASSASAVVAAVAAIAYLAAEKAAAGEREEARSRADAERAASRGGEPSGLMPSSRDASPVTFAVGLLTSHLYFQLPAAALKRLLAECVSAAGGIIETLRPHDALREWTAFSLVVAVLLGFLAAVCLGWGVGSAASRLRRGCGWRPALRGLAAGSRTEMA